VQATEGGTTPGSSGCRVRADAWLYGERPSFNERERRPVPACPPRLGAVRRCSMLPVAGRTCLNRSWQCPQALGYWLIARYRTVARDNTPRYATPSHSLPLSPKGELNLNEFLLPQHLWSPSADSVVVNWVFTTRQPILLLVSSSVHGKFTVYARYQKPLLIITTSSSSKSWAQRLTVLLLLTGFIWLFRVQSILALVYASSINQSIYLHSNQNVVTQ